MQLHPTDPDRSAAHAANCIARGLIGLDFWNEVGDLRKPLEGIDPKQKDYRLFQSEMAVGDLVLVQAHPYPFALVEVASDYVYVPNAKEELQVWFRHLRFVRNVRLYADYVKRPENWQKIVMTDTFSPLRSSDGLAYRLIESWAAK